jgi:hypothetical protein
VPPHFRRPASPTSLPPSFGLRSSAVGCRRRHVGPAPAGACAVTPAEGSRLSSEEVDCKDSLPLPSASLRFPSLQLNPIAPPRGPMLDGAGDGGPRPWQDGVDPDLRRSALVMYVFLSYCPSLDFPPSLVGFWIRPPPWWWWGSTSTERGKGIGWSAVLLLGLETLDCLLAWRKFLRFDLLYGS